VQGRERERNGKTRLTGNETRNSDTHRGVGRKKKDSENSKEEKPNPSCLHRVLEKNERGRGRREREDSEYRTAEVDFPTLQQQNK